MTELTGERLRIGIPAGTGGVNKTDYTAKGDILAGSAASAPDALHIAGTTGYVLTVTPAAATGMDWATPAAGTPSGTAVAQTVFAAATTAGTSAEYSRGDHAHGTPTNPVAGTAHADLTGGVHGVAAGSTIASSAEIATHALLTATHGAGTIASVAAATALITTHAGSTDAHIGGAGTVLSTAAGTVLIAAHAAITTGIHGVGTSLIASTANITSAMTTHAALTTGVHGVGTSLVASTAQITSAVTTHTALTTGVHGLGTISGAASTDYYKVAATIQLSENVGIILDAALSATGKYSGIIETGTSGTALVFGDVVYLLAASTRWMKTLASTATTSNGKLGISCGTTAAADTVDILLWGKISSTTFPAMSVGAPIFLSAGTAGYVSGTASAGTTGYTVRIVGYGNSATELFFKPDNTYLEMA